MKISLKELKNIIKNIINEEYSEENSKEYYKSNVLSSLPIEIIKSDNEKKKEFIKTNYEKLESEPKDISDRHTYYKIENGKLYSLRRPSHGFNKPYEWTEWGVKPSKKALIDNP